MRLFGQLLFKTFVNKHNLTAVVRTHMLGIGKNNT
jgi:hypothetical protein